MAPLDINSKLKMNSGYEIPILGYGASDSFQPADAAQDLVQKAFDAGYRHIDSAAAYRNESPCGLAIRSSPLPRSSIFFTSKIPARNLSYTNTVSQISKTLQETGLEYIDLMLIHAPYGGSEARKGAWKALVEAQEEGKIRSLGVSNYGVHHLEELEGHIRELEEERGGKGKGGVISVGQWELHPWLPRPDITTWCRARNIILEAYSPLVRGERLDSELLQPLAKKYQKTPAQILLRWSLQKGFVPLPKSVTPSRIKENADVYDFELTEEEMKGLETGEYAPCCWDPTKAGLED
ncbi:Aldo keto reductase protein [Rutstroemia sp. NJR-2017a WRK4]|nr:Aldo keto reductase protein [Rutstroemia sp. NJR-2017a WRK4]